MRCSLHASKFLISAGNSGDDCATFSTPTVIMTLNLLTVSGNNIIQVFFKWRCRKTHLKINNTEKEVRCDETLRRRPSHWREMPRC